ncbi:MAG: hypothetical protein CL760_10935 [Chloroflexi bacterium]|nr:hypothetical protein [Chloroflexota bacterium]|tara:strand:- start:20326 stop:20940 length:615 start_codon:yes stop_codon:yes gene_type:complete
MNKKFLKYLLEKKESVIFDEISLEEGDESDFFGFSLLVEIEDLDCALRFKYVRESTSSDFFIESGVSFINGFTLERALNLYKTELYLLKEELVLILESLDVETIFMSQKLDSIKNKEIEEMEQEDICVHVTLKEKGSLFNKEKQLMEAFIRNEVGSNKLLEFSFLNKTKILKLLFNMKQEETVKLFKSTHPHDWSEILELNYNV